MNLDNSYVVIDISELSGDLLTVGMYIGLDYMWDKAKEDLTRRKQIFIDEVWQIIGASSNALAATMYSRPSRRFAATAVVYWLPRRI